MRAHLTTVGAVDFPHLLLDERMPGLAQHRLAAMAANDVYGVPGQARIVNDAGTGLAFEKRRGQQSHEVVTLDELTLLVEEEAAIVVPVPGQAHIGTRAAHDIRRRRAILLE